MSILDSYDEIMAINVTKLAEQSNFSKVVFDELALDLEEKRTLCDGELIQTEEEGVATRKLIDECRNNIKQYESAVEDAIAAKNTADAEALKSKKSMYVSLLHKHETQLDKLDEKYKSLFTLHQHIVFEQSSINENQFAHSLPDAPWD